MIRFGDGITQDDITLHMDGTTLVINYGDQGDAIRLPDFDYNEESGSQVVGALEFADGSGVRLADLLDPGTEGDDYILGSYFEDTIDAKGGDDTVTSFESTDHIDGGSGADTIDAGAGYDVIAGGTGDDALTGGPGHDTYLFNPGDGVDSIDDTATTYEGNVIQFGDGITFDDLTISYEDDTLIVNVGSNGDQLRLTGFDREDALGSHAVETFRFADGSKNTYAELIAKGFDIIGTPDDDEILGTNVDDRIQGLAGNDTITSGAGADLLAGGSGADTLTGGEGHDTYLFNPGDGTDTIIDESLTDEGNVIQFGDGITFDDLTLSYEDDTLIINVGSNGDQLRLSGFDREDALGTHAVETFRFADGSENTYEELIAKGFDLTGTPEDDEILGTNTDDRIQGLAGNDVIDSGAGADLLDGGSGADTMAGGIDDDTYVVDDPGDVVTESPFEGIDTVQAMVDYILGSDVEELQLVGTGAINGIGNNLDNLLKGNAAANVLDGAAGSGRDERGRRRRHIHRGR